MDETTQKVGVSGGQSAAVDRLDAAIAEYVRDLADRHGWRETGRQHSAAAAARSYLWGNLALTITYERGILDLTIGPATSRSTGRNASRFRDLVAPPRQGRWNLGLGGGMAFLASYATELDAMLAPARWQDTIRRVDAART